VVGELAYMYSVNKKNAQLIVLMLLASQRTRYFHSMMFDDEFAVMLLVSAIYFVSWNRPVLASWFITMSLGLKSDALYVVPAFLGVVMVNFGVLNFGKSLVCIVGM